MNKLYKTITLISSICLLINLIQVYHSNILFQESFISTAKTISSALIFWGLLILFSYQQRLILMFLILTFGAVIILYNSIIPINEVILLGFKQTFMMKNFYSFLGGLDIILNMLVYLVFIIIVIKKLMEYIKFR